LGAADRAIATGGIHEVMAGGDVAAVAVIGETALPFALVAVMCDACRGGDAADQALIELRNAMDKVNFRPPPQQVLDDLLMAIVRGKAAKALQLVQVSKMT
ncbi:MAG: hypothetical protein KGI29_07000, partial [Pseudomonadota bacterium]|nr:hypothetical protein [Pseudomonadota bacterium]